MKTRKPSKKNPMTLSEFGNPNVKKVVITDYRDIPYVLDQLEAEMKRLA